MIRIPSAVILGGLMAAAACTNPAGNSEGPGMQAAKAPAGPSVQTATPAYGHQGEQGKVVRIKGSGFDNGSTARWELNGTPDPEVTVVSTQFVSSTELDATINITSAAELAFYDVAVTTSKGRKGIGTELFEVTQAIGLNGTTRARWANESGQIVGQGPGGAFFWSAATGMQSLSSDGIGMAVSEDGLTVTGSLGSDDWATKRPVVWTRSGGTWVRSNLPMDPAAFPPAQGHALASDPVTGAAVAIAGWEGANKKSQSWRARLWIPSGGTWQRIVLPGSGSPSPHSLARDVNHSLVVVGGAGGAALWEPNGGGGWNVRLIGPGDLNAINEAGTLTVGRLNGNIPMYYKNVGGTWTGPFTLPGSCENANDVDESGRILMISCPVPGPRSRSTSAVIVPPYGADDITYLGGFGTTTGPLAERMSSLGTWIVGSSTVGNSTVGAYWKLF